MWIQIFNWLYLIGCFFNAALYIPQILILYKKKDPVGVSLFTFVGFSLIQCVAIANGFYYHDMPLFIGKIASLFMSLNTVFLILLYRYKMRSDDVVETPYTGVS